MSPTPCIWMQVGCPSFLDRVRDSLILLFKGKLMVCIPTEQARAMLEDIRKRDLLMQSGMFRSDSAWEDQLPALQLDAKGRLMCKCPNCDLEYSKRLSEPRENVIKDINDAWDQIAGMYPDFDREMEKIMIRLRAV